MLKTRVITAIVMAIVFLLALFTLGKTSFSLFLDLVAIACAWEWAGISGVKSAPKKAIYSGFVLMLMLLMQFVFVDSAVIDMVVILAVMWWLSVAWVLYRSPVAKLPEEGPSHYFLIAGPLTIVPAMLAAEFLRDTSPWILLYALAIVWTMDIGAYFSGKRFGKHKLAPLISPGKTIEGVVGGILATLIFCLLVVAFGTFETPTVTIFVLATVVSGALSVMGDLFESRGKRMVGLKDSGHLLPGHGGFLDRLDSAFVALPLFTYAIIWL